MAIHVFDLTIDVLDQNRTTDQFSYEPDQQVGMWELVAVSPDVSGATRTLAGASLTLTDRISSIDGVIAGPYDSLGRLAV